MSLARRVLSNTLIQIFGKALTALMSVAIVKIITSYLGVEGYGAYTTVYEFLAFFSIAIDLGLFTIGVREMSKDETKIPLILGNILSIRTILGVLILGGSILTAFLIPAYQGTFIPLGVAIATITTFLNIINGTLTTVLQVHLKMESSVYALVIGKIISLIYMVWVILISFKDNSEAGFYQLLIAGIIGNAVMLLITYFATRKYTTIHFRFDWIFWREVVGKSLPYGIALILNTIYFRLDVILLSLMKDNMEVGIYGVALRMLEVLMIVPIFFMNAVLPIMTRFLREKNEKLITLWQYSFDFLFAIGLPILVGTNLLARPIVKLISSEEFLSRPEAGFWGSDVALQILMFALLLIFLNTLFSFTLVALEKQAKLLWINLGCVFFKLAVSLAIIPSFGFRGAAVSSVLAEFFILVFVFIIVHKHFKLRLKISSILKISLSAGTMGAFIWLVHPLLLTILNSSAKAVLSTVLLGGTIYIIMLFAIKGISKDMLKLVFKK